jgi:uncharacterized membrane protein YvbJ
MNKLYLNRNKTKTNMALIDCPECGTQVSDKAERCLKCAYPINSNNTNSASDRNTQTRTETNVVVKSNEGCFLQTLNTGCMIVAILIGVIVLVGILSAL